MRRSRRRRQLNTTSGQYSSVAGGSDNQAVDTWCAVSGGRDNVAGDAGAPDAQGATVSGRCGLNANASCAHLP